MTARVLAVVLLLAGCGDNADPIDTPPDCSGKHPPATGLTIEGAREAHRRAALRQRLRYREATDPGYTLRMTAAIADQARIDRGLVCTQDLYEAGRLIFEHQYSYEEGLAGPGPGLVGFRRVQEGRRGGPETNACTSCHWRNGPAGAGGFPDDSYILGDGEHLSSGDARNPPSLLGSGVVQELAEEMTADLAALRDDAISRAKQGGAPVDVDLLAKGVSFGTLHVDKSGRVDTSDVRGVDPDLVIRPFGWKGTSRTINEFVSEAAALHFGIQSEDAVVRAAGSDAQDPLDLGSGAPEDRDEDGVADELTAGQVTALSVYVAALEIPVMRPHEQPVDRTHPEGPTIPYLVDEWTRGRALFDQIGCASCHVPALPLRKTQVEIRSPVTGGVVTVDLVKDAESPHVTDGEAFVFSDFKRHDLGDANASRHLQHGIAPRFYLTRRLWGAGDSSPYFYDGQSPTIDHAIGRHGGEAAFARDAFAELSIADRSALRIFITSLRREPRLSIP